MGLPLFVAKTEKDSPAKASGKDGALAPSRSAIRRQPTPRDRHSNQTRQAALRALAISPPYLPPALERYRGGSFPWNNSEPSVDPERRSPSIQPPEPSRAATRNPISRDAQRPDAVSADERTPVPPWELYANQSPPRSLGQSPEDRSWRWPADLRPPPRRARVVTPAGSRQTNPNRRLRPRAINSPPPPLPGPSRATRPSRGVDGLGDRDRSLSPEGWDTLGATVAPDPQAPSAGSSFASTAASNMEGPFSLQAREASQAPEGPDGGCESGLEDSGEEAPEFEEYHRHMRRRRAELRRRSLGIPDFDPSASLADDGSLGARHPARESRIPGAIARLRINRLRRQQMRLETRLERIHAASSGDETETDRSRQAGEGSAGRRVSPTTGEDDEWMGLQRIMHSLAAREEIPDEMWAEVGLIRTLMRQEETN